VRTGGARKIEVDGKYKVWTKRVGRGGIKVLTLHGGPGGTHQYFECFEDYLPQEGIEFYYYDQLGCGNADHPDDPKLWNLERFGEEVEQVRAALGLDQFILLGHSWGGMLAIEYALKHPQRLKKVVISNMSASIASYETRIAKLRAAIPAAARLEMEKFEKAGQYEAPRYEELLMEHLYSKNICRVVPFPDPVERAFRDLGKPVYNAIQGPNEFVVKGSMKGWDRWKDLPRITMPALVIGSEHDELDPKDLERMAKLMPKGQFGFCPNGSHMCMYDDQENYFRILVPFLKA
jgi:proline iminopeptidase